MATPQHHYHCRPKSICEEDVMASCDRNLLGQTAALDHEKQGRMPVKAEVVGAGKRPTRRGSAETFTGVVFQELLTTANLPSRLAGLVDTFARARALPGTRIRWGRPFTASAGPAASVSTGSRHRCSNQATWLRSHPIRCTGTAPHPTSCLFISHCRRRTRKASEQRGASMSVRPSITPVADKTD